MLFAGVSTSEVGKPGYENVVDQNGGALSGVEILYTVFSHLLLRIVLFGSSVCRPICIIRGFAETCHDHPHSVDTERTVAYAVDVNISIPKRAMLLFLEEPRVPLRRY